MNRKLSQTLLSSAIVVGAILMAASAQAQSPDRWVDAAVTTQGATYLFQGPAYLRFHDARLDPGYPRPLAGGGWQGLPVEFEAGIDAALYAADRAKTYFFKGNQYLRLTGVTVDPGYPLALPGGWQGLPAEFHDGIDAALYSGGHIFFFKAARYARFTGNQLDPGYPLDLPGGWELPPDLRQIDAAVSYNGKNYLFAGPSYIRLTGASRDADYPRALPGGWVGLSMPGNAPAAPGAPAGTGATPGLPPSGPSGRCWAPAVKTTLEIDVRTMRECRQQADPLCLGLPLSGAAVEVRSAGGVSMLRMTDESGLAVVDLAAAGEYVVSLPQESVSRTVNVLPNCINFELFEILRPPVTDDRCAAVARESASCLTANLAGTLSDCDSARVGLIATCTDARDRGETAAYQACMQWADDQTRGCIDPVNEEVARCRQEIMTRAGC